MFFKGSLNLSLGCGNSLVRTLWGHQKIYLPKTPKLSSCAEYSTMFILGCKKKHKKNIHLMLQERSHTLRLFFKGSQNVSLGCGNIVGTLEEIGSQNTKYAHL
jgi:hypothetical protein